MMADLQCPRCHSDALYSYGRIKSGKQRFLCLLCNRQFTPGHEHPKTDDHPECPACGAKMHIYRREPNVIRYRCANYPACRQYIKKVL
jgi:transposase-like protein